MKDLGLILSLFSLFILTPAFSMDKIILKNEYWNVVIEPRWGARASSMRSIQQNYDFVSYWGDVKTRSDGEARDGGVFRSMMSGSYVSSQPEEPYTVIRTSATEAILEYENRHPLMDGLYEEKKIILEETDVVFSVKVSNRARENRVVYYRIQDWIGTGKREGKDSVHIIPKELNLPFTFISNQGESVNRHFVSPSENWYALADIVSNKGLLVKVNRTVAGIYFWESGKGASMRTAEIFFPCVTLMPGQSWYMEVRYRAFEPDNPDTGDDNLNRILLKNNILKCLSVIEAKNVKSGLPFNAEMKLPYTKEPLKIAPVHPASPSLGGEIAPDYGKTLNKIYLYGTPGEVISFAFAATANEDIKKGEIIFSDLKSAPRRKISKEAFDPKYVAGESKILVHNWGLVQHIPESIAHINNDIFDPDTITPFSLKQGDTAYIWTNLRIPENAAAGTYSGICSINTGREQIGFKISLKVRPFKLVRAEHKTYSTFMPYYIKPPDGEPAGPLAKYMISREEYLKIMKVFRDIGFSSLVIYVSRRDDLLWVIDRAKELGMKGAFVLIYPYSIKPEDIEERCITAFGWVIDEPSMYIQVPHAIKMYENMVKRGFTPTFTPNLPLGLIIADILDKMVPIINTNGNAPYLIDVTKRYHDAGRKVFWYEAHGLGVPSVEQRALRGIYLWKEPVDGIYDWDNGSISPKLSNHHMAGFAGTKLLPRLGLENTRQALTDLNYLYTLETLSQQCKNAGVRAEAEQLMNWIKGYFNSDYYKVIPYISDPQYLDDIRQEVADMIENIVKSHK